MRIEHIFQGWEKDGNLVYSQKEGASLSSANFVSGKKFKGNIELKNEEGMELFMAIIHGYSPIFSVTDDPAQHDERLGPCPFCKKNRCFVVRSSGEYKTLYVHCNHCQYQGPIEICEEKAIEDHNRISNSK